LNNPEKKNSRIETNIDNSNCTINDVIDQLKFNASNEAM